MKSFCLNGLSGRQERWALDGHRWVAAEPRRDGFDLWGYQDDTPEIVYLGSGANEQQLEKLADEFLLGDPEIINPAFRIGRRRRRAPRSHYRAAGGGGHLLGNRSGRERCGEPRRQAPEAAALYGYHGHALGRARGPIDLPTHCMRR